ncbi:MAG: hypothetical protein ABIY55_01860 [Kofleriaceae bacterium]
MNRGNARHVAVKAGGGRALIRVGPPPLSLTPSAPRHPRWLRRHLGHAQLGYPHRMDEGGYWGLIEGAWQQQVDGGAISATLAGGGSPGPAALESVLGLVVREVVARLEALPVDDARSAVEHHRTSVRALDRERIPGVVGTWMYDLDGCALAVVPLLGESFFRRVVVDPESAAVIRGAPGLGTIGGWRALAGPVRARWRAALIAEIPGHFAEVEYPGDADVTSSDWPTTEDCRYFCGKDWRTLDRSALYRRYADISFVTPRGLQYLLPAFLLAALEDVDGSRTCGDSIAHQLLFKLSHGYMRRCVALLSDGQRQVLTDVLRLEYENSQHGPFADHDDDLALAVAQLDVSRSSPRRPRRR